MPSGFKGEALVLSSSRQGEANRVVLFYTRDRGRISAMAHGSRKPGSRFGGLLEPGVLVDAVFRKPFRGGTLYTVSECSLVRSYSSMPVSLEQTETLLSFLAFFRGYVREGEEDNALFQMVKGLLDLFADGRIPYSHFRLFWLSALLRHAGVLPEWTGCVRCGGIDSGMALSGHGPHCRSCLTDGQILATLSGGDMRLLSLFALDPLQFPSAVRITEEQRCRLEGILGVLYKFYRSGT